MTAGATSRNAATVRPPAIHTFLVPDRGDFVNTGCIVRV
jgi:hypothetical protein